MSGSIPRFRPSTLIAALGAVAFTFGGLIFLSSKAVEGPAATVLKPVLAVAGLLAILFFLSRVFDQVRAARVGNWLESEEGRAWLDELPEDERRAFEEQLENYR
jgi:hypothetical protein